MRINRFLLMLMVAAALIGSAFSYQGTKKPRTLDDYKPRTLKELAASHTGDSSGSDSVVNGDLLPSRARVTYTGSMRKLSQSRKDVISIWAQRFAGMPEFYTTPYEEEVLFADGVDEYWLAVKRELLPEFAKEFKKGDAVDLNLIRLGRFKSAGKWEPVLLVEAVAKPQPETTNKP